jgi:hypothetical protein
LRLNTLYHISVEVIGGSTLGETFKEVVLLVNEIDKPIEFNFSGLDIVAVPGDSVERLREAYNNYFRDPSVRSGRITTKRIREQDKFLKPRKVVEEPVLPERNMRRIVLSDD